MEIKNQICSPTQAQKLKSLGVWQESYFYFTPGLSIPHPLSKKEKIIFQEHYSAFTVAELGAMLPKRLKASWKHEDNTGLGGTWESSCNTKLEFDYDDKNGLYIVKYPLLSSTQHKSEAVARAGMLISLLGKQLITPDEINQRLKTA